MRFSKGLAAVVLLAALVLTGLAGCGSVATMPDIDATVEARVQETLSPDSAAPALPTVETNRAALVAFYHSANGTDWTNNENWLTGEQLSNWYGVITNDDGLVIELDLEENNLTGTIAPELGNLSNLHSLWLDKNQLAGSIPPELGNLSNIVNLDLDSNQLTGPIPPELGNLSNVKRLELEDNKLTGTIPAELGNLPQVEDLELARNQLTGLIPVELGNLSTLTDLYLEGNQLSGSIPPELGNLHNLQALTLGRNQLTGTVPQELCDLTALSYIELEGNQLTGAIPPELCGSPDKIVQETGQGDREVLVEFYNATGGPQWENNGNWLSDEALRDWHGVSTDQNGRVTQLYLASNNLTGAIPPGLANLPALNDLALWGNQLTGPIPPELGNSPNLQGLTLDQNQLTGTIPSELGNLANLVGLNLVSNQLTGPIPPELGNLSNLQSLHLYSNQLVGSVPPELGNLSKLRFLLLDEKQLPDGLPMALCKLPDGTVRVWDGQFLNDVPTELCRVNSAEVMAEVDLLLQVEREVLPKAELANYAYLNNDSVSCFAAEQEARKYMRIEFMGTAAFRDYPWPGKHDLYDEKRRKALAEYVVKHGSEEIVAVLKSEEKGYEIIIRACGG